MYVRWKRRPAAPPTLSRVFNKGGDYYYAVVVRSERVDGKPRQKVVKHLAGFHPSELVPKGDHPGYHQNVLYYRRRFWWAVDDGLDELSETGDLTHEARAVMEERIADRVPKLTEEERAGLNARAAAVRTQLAAMGIRM